MDIHFPEKRINPLELKVDQSDSESQKTQIIETEVARFFSDPMVYPTLQSLIDDIHFKTQIDIEYKVLAKSMLPVTAFSSLKRSDRMIFLVPKKILHESKSLVK